MVLFGVARAFAMPTGQALLPNLVPRAQFGTAVALNSSTWQVATIAGPALGGIVYLAGAPVVYASVAALLAVAGSWCCGLRAGGATRRARRAARLAGAAVGPALRALAPARARRDLARPVRGAVRRRDRAAAGVRRRRAARGPGGLGWLRTAPGIGAALCGLVLGVRPITRQVGRWMFGGVIVFGLATLVFGLSTSFWLSLAALVVMGAGDMVSVYVRHLLVQLETPDEIRGRVSAVNAVFIGASNELGEFESGVTAAWFGTVPAVIVGGCATLVVAGVWSRLFPESGAWTGSPRPHRDDCICIQYPLSMRRADRQG